MDDSPWRPARSQFGGWVTRTRDPEIRIDRFDQGADAALDVDGRVGKAAKKMRDRSQSGRPGSRVETAAVGEKPLDRTGRREAMIGLSGAIEAKPRLSRNFFVDWSLHA